MMTNGRINSNDSAGDAFAALQRIKDEGGRGAQEEDTQAEQQEDQAIADLEAGLQKALSAVQVLKGIQQREQKSASAAPTAPKSSSGKVSATETRTRKLAYSHSYLYLCMLAYSHFIYACYVLYVLFTSLATGQRNSQILW